MLPPEPAQGAGAPRVTAPGGDCAVTRLPGQRAGAQRSRAASNERVPYGSSEPFGETRLLLSSVPLSAAPPQNALVFSGLLT